MLSVFSSSECSLFHKSNLFGSCIIYILYAGVLKLKKNNSSAKRLRMSGSIPLFPLPAYMARTGTPVPHFYLF